MGKIDKKVFSITAIFYLSIFLFIIIVPDIAAAVIADVLNFSLDSLGWIYVLAFAFFLIAYLAIGLSRYGKLKLGKPEDKPEYSFFSWMGLLFGAGLGVGLVFYGVYEPVCHFITSMYAESGTAAAASDAIKQTFFHWSLVPWAGYGIAGLCIAYFTHRRGLPGMVSSSFYPLLGKKALTGTIGKVIDAFASIAVICGISMSTGFAVTQFVSGLSMQYGLNNNILMIAMAVIGVGFIATACCMSGLNKGIKFISELNMWIILLLIGFALLCGPTLYLIKVFFQGMGSMIGDFISMMFFLDANQEVASQVGFDWVSGWTIFYWAWWIAFVPFVGGFLADISKGRTIREFVLASVFVPGLLCCIWFAFFGGGAIHMTLFGGSNVANLAAANMDNSLFIFLQELPISAITIPISMVLILTLIITSVNSATHVLGRFSIGGRGEPTIWNRAFWCIFIVVNAILFLWIGGLEILKNIAVVFALPFTIIMLFMVCGLMKDLKTAGEEDVYQPYIEDDEPEQTRLTA